MQRTVTAVVSSLSCAFLAYGCTTTPKEAPVAPTGRLELSVAPLEGADVYQCNYRLELLYETEPGSGDFTAYIDQQITSDGPAAAFATVLPCHAGDVSDLAATLEPVTPGAPGTPGAGASRLNLARLTVDSCIDDAGGKVTAAFPYVQSRLFECVAERDTRLDYTFFIERELARGFADITAQVFGYEIAAKADCAESFVPYADEDGVLRRMPAMIAALAWQTPDALGQDISLYSFHDYQTSATLPDDVGVTEYIGTELDGETHYHNVVGPAPVGATSSLDRYALFGTAGTRPARIDHGTPVLAWQVASDGTEGAACDVAANSAVSACQLTVANDDGGTSLISLVPGRQIVDGVPVRGLTVIGGPADADAGAPAHVYIARNDNGDPINIAPVTCCVDGCCTGEDN